MLPPLTLTDKHPGISLETGVWQLWWEPDGTAWYGVCYLHADGRVHGSSLVLDGQWWPVAIRSI